jgi:hypothetical protein
MSLLIREEATKTCSELPTVTVARRKGGASLRFQHKTSLGLMASRAGREMVDRRVIPMAIAAVLVGAAPASSESESASAAPSDALIIQVKDQAELNEKFCAANPNMEHVLVLPASLFVDAQQVICASGPYKLYRIIEHDDTDDFEYFLDPPIYGKANRLGCDGKAGMSMQTIAVNCRPLK